MQAFVSIFLSFCVYSFLGWVCETVYCSVGRRRFVNRGFLNGPVCPVYGFGALAVLYLLAPFSRQPILLFFSAMLLTSLLEYITGFLLEKLFHTRWWDYSAYPFNLHGRVCLRNSLLFGLIALVAVLFIDPAVQRGLRRLPARAAFALALLLGAAFLVDTVLSVRSALALSKKAEQLAALCAELREKSEAYRDALREALAQHTEEAEALREAIRERLDALPRLAGSEQWRAELRERLDSLPHAAHSEPVPEAVRARIAELRARTDALHERIEQLSQRREKLALSAGSHRRLLSAFPGMRSSAHEGVLEELRAAIAARSTRETGEASGSAGEVPEK